jgi:hypothetical protein
MICACGVRVASALDTALMRGFLAPKVEHEGGNLCEGEHFGPEL